MRARIESDLKSALKAGEKRRVGTLRLLLSSLQNERIGAGRELTDGEIEAVIRRAVKQRRESIDQYTKGGREDLARAEAEELALLEAYLPAGLSDSEVEAEIRSAVERAEARMQANLVDVFDHVYAEPTETLRAQRAELERELQAGAETARG